jgi:hypothetical protein
MLAATGTIFPSTSNLRETRLQIYPLKEITLFAEKKGQKQMNLTAKNAQKYSPKSQISLT